MPSPALLVVSGLPASGKTHLGSRLARELGWPFVSKDEYKAILHGHLPELTRAQAGPLSFEIMYHVAGVVLAITFVGGEVAQTTIGLPNAATGIFQAMMLFLLLASDILVRYRLRVVRPGEVTA